MHYFKRNIGDYHKKAGRLTMLQHGAYTLLLDSCYDREEFPTMEMAIDWVWASSEAETEAVKFVLNKFFVLEEGVFVQYRIQDELERYHKNASTNQRIAMEREAKRKEKRTKREPIVNEAPPNQEPLTTNQEPIKSKVDKIDNTAVINFDSVIEIFNRVMIRSPKVKKLNDKRKRLVRNLFKFAEFDLVKFEGYLNYMHSTPSWNWAFEKSTGTNNINYKECSFEYFMKEDTYLKASEEIQ
jgi:uncharacterized protein YdaU (DUF1376 family)